MYRSVGIDLCSQMCPQACIQKHVHRGGNTEVPQKMLGSKQKVMFLSGLPWTLTSKDHMAINFILPASIRRN